MTRGRSAMIAPTLVALIGGLVNSGARPGGRLGGARHARRARCGGRPVLVGVVLRLAVAAVGWFGLLLLRRRGGRRPGSDASAVRRVALRRLAVRDIFGQASQRRLRRVANDASIGPRFRRRARNVVGRRRRPRFAVGPARSVAAVPIGLSLSKYQGAWWRARCEPTAGSPRRPVDHPGPARRRGTGQTRARRAPFYGRAGGGRSRSTGPAAPPPVRREVVGGSAPPDQHDTPGPAAAPERGRIGTPDGAERIVCGPSRAAEQRKATRAGTAPPPRSQAERHPGIERIRRRRWPSARPSLPSAGHVGGRRVSLTRGKGTIFSCGAGGYARR
jgi:hypothetical protein